MSDKITIRGKHRDGSEYKYNIDTAIDRRYNLIKEVNDKRLELKKLNEKISMYKKDREDWWIIKMSQRLLFILKRMLL